MTASYKLYRKGDPDTSREAAENIPTSRLETIVLAVIARFPEGVISDDVRRICADEFITARYKALKEKGLIKCIGKRVGKSGRYQRIMHLASREAGGMSRLATLQWDRVAVIL